AATTMVATGESVSGDLGTECMPAGVPSLPRVPAYHDVPAGRSVMKSLVTVMLMALGAVAFAQGKTSPGAGPAIVVVETEKGTFEFETYPNEAPKTVAHIVGLINKRFYNG